MNVNLVVRRHRHHAQVSGYDRISEHIPARLIHRVETPSLLQRLAVRALRPLHARSGSLWYGRAGLGTELVAARHWLRGSGQVFHFVYGENSYRYLGYLKPLRRNFIVCTYHTPPSRFAEVVRNRRHLATIDAAIVVARVCGELLAEVLGEERVHFIPHGVDVEYFKPAAEPSPRPKGPFRVLCVGSHLRDFATLARLAAHYARGPAPVRFEVITSPSHFRHFDGLSNVRLRSGIDDLELRAAYRSAELLVMPLTDATANNTLLEAMACGLPIVSSDLPGVRDYVVDDIARLVPVGELEALVDAVDDLRDDPQARAQMARRARQHALQFAFPRVAQQTQELYRRVLSRESLCPSVS